MNEINAAQYVATFNTPGVAEWANQSGYAGAVTDANTAFEFIRMQYNINPKATTLKVKDLHPHIQNLEHELGTSLVPKMQACNTKTIKSNGYSNYIDADGTEHADGALAQFGRAITEGLDRTVQTIRNFSGNQNSVQKDPTNEMLKILGVFVVGGAIGYIIAKK